jgi:hypothetical protein
MTKPYLNLFEGINMKSILSAGIFHCDTLATEQESEKDLP